MPLKKKARLYEILRLFQCGTFMKSDFVFSFQQDEGILDVPILTRNDVRRTDSGYTAMIQNEKVSLYEELDFKFRIFFCHLLVKSGPMVLKDPPPH